MPQKRKQRDEDLTDSVVSPHLKKLKAAPSLSQREVLNVTTSNPLTPSPTQKIKHGNYVNIQPSTTLSRTHRITTETSSSNFPTVSRLHPRGVRRTAKVDQKDETLLRLLCDDTETGEAKELHFRNIPHSSIDWTNAEHIRKINNWRNQLYGRAGIKTKSIAMWLPDEELWLELYWQLSIAESRLHGLLVPRSSVILDAFNETFVGRVIKDVHGNDTAPRQARRHNAFTAKLNRVCSHLRERLHQCTFGKSGDVFVPKITLGMLHAYRDMKMEMREMGIVEESAYSDHLEHWCRLFSNLPKLENLDKRERSFSAIEYDAATALLDLANPPVDARRPATPVPELDVTSLIASPN
ncbi:hypothetical protein BDU57DRAFT_598828 [Ampelomyces quisqualis]|uniref:Uncharacterized protein n=1 Tax=Ampelomyces quisqualis TaxID=50730 RepID=A0A6A5Q8C1_AMPQU|nr:hypothetical protein BDU57DRAFT_598828 [Ampelomyces quisqualis]